MKKSITSFIAQLSKKNIALVVLALFAASTVTAFAAWGPERPTFDYNDPVGRKGSLNGPVFNSFINAPKYGDERNFVTVSKAGSADWKGSVTAEEGQEIELRAYVHNNANQSTNASGKGIAKNTRVRFDIPAGQANGFNIPGYVSADNATPKQVFDTANITNPSKAFSLSYVPGSAKLYNNGAFKNGVAISDGVVGAGGTLIGDTALNGNLSGCFEYKAVVIIKVKVKTPALKINKSVTTPGSSDWKQTLKVKRGDTVSWLIDFKNTGSDVLNKLTIRDVVPKGVTLVPGSIMWFDSNRPNGQPLGDTALGSGGVNLGTYGSQGGGYIRFRTTVDKEGKDCTIKNVAFGRGENVTEQNDDAEVTIENCNPPTEEEEFCKVPGKENLPVDSPDCVEATTVTKVTTIPSTGVAGIASGLVGGTALSYSLYAWAESKRTLKNLLRLK